MCVIPRILASLRSTAFDIVMHNILHPHLPNTSQQQNAAATGKLIQGVRCCAVFTNRLDDIRMQDLAEMDVSEAVISVQVSSACNAVNFE